jgi:hypothetical protein
MIATITLGVVTLGLMLILKYWITPKYGDDVSSRFIERSNYIPSQNPALLDRLTLTQWLADERNREAIAGYIAPVLFPLDLLFMVSLGLFLGCASTALAAALSFLAHVPAWVWWALPLSYVLADFAEDALVAAIFKSAVKLTDDSYTLLRTLTRVKLATVGIAIGQAVFLGGLFVILFFFPTSKPV